MYRPEEEIVANDTVDPVLTSHRAEEQVHLRRVGFRLEIG